jgi:hypothetical protein
MVGWADVEGTAFMTVMGDWVVNRKGLVLGYAYSISEDSYDFHDEKTESHMGVVGFRWCQHPRGGGWGLNAALIVGTDVGQVVDWLGNTDTKVAFAAHLALYGNWQFGRKKKRIFGEAALGLVVGLNAREFHYMTPLIEVDEESEAGVVQPIGFLGVGYAF